MVKKNGKVAVLASVTSDIGVELAERLSKEGWTVVGTYRSKALLDRVSKSVDHIYYSDLIEVDSTKKFIEDFKSLGLKWDLFISCAGTQKPIGNFVDCDFEQWSDSIHVNAIEQLRVFHSLYPYRKSDKISDVVFFAGPGTNNSVPKYSAYTASKIMLIKMCELIDSENKDLNIFTVGPGWVKTKMHYETLSEERSKIGPNYEKTAEFMKQDGGTSMDDIFNCIMWFCSQGKKTASGRNYSVVHDKWKKETSEELAGALDADNNMYKLRRFNNDWQPKL